MLELYFYGLLQTLIVIILAYIVGKTLTPIIRFTNSTFHSLLIGFLTIIALPPIIITAGKSLAIFYILLIVSLPLLLNNKSKKITFNLKVKELLIILPIAIIYYTFFFYNLIDFINGKINILHRDFVFYSNITKMLDYLKVETVYYDFVNKENYPVLYHYGDIWSALLFLKLFNQNSFFSYVVLSAGIWSTISFFGLLEIIKKVFKKIRWYHYIIVLFFYGIFPVTFPIGYFFEKFLPLYDYGLFSLRLIFILNLFLLLTYEILNNNIIGMITSISIISIFYSSLLPTMLTTIVLLTISIYLINYKRKEKIPLIKIVYLFIINVGILMFYKLLGKTSTLPREMIIELKNYYLSTKSLITIIKIIIHVILQVIIISSYILIFLFLTLGFKNVISNIRKHQREIIISTIIYISGIAAYIVLHQIVDSVQMWSFPHTMIFQIATILLLITMTLNTKRLMVMILWLLLFLPQYYLTLNKPPTLSIKEYTLLKQKFGNENFIKNKSVFLFPKSSINSIYQAKIFFNRPIKQFNFINDTYIPICISLTEVENYIKNEIKNKFIRFSLLGELQHSIYGKYLKKHNLSDSPEAKLKFIKENNVKYLVKHKDYILSPELKKLLKEKLYTFNNRWEFYSLKY